MSETPKLKLLYIARNRTDNWDEDEDANKNILDANPGIPTVADNTAMLALDVWQGRVCFNESEGINGMLCVYRGAAWEVLDSEVVLEVANFAYLGEYSSGATYVEYNLVYYDDGGTYVGTFMCIDDNGGVGITDIPPSNDLYWAPIAPATVGPQGPEGEKGDMPDHDWDGTEIRFQLPNGDWGAFVDLEGPDGPQGEQGPEGPEGPEGPAGGVAGPMETVSAAGVTVAGDSSQDVSVQFNCSEHTGAQVQVMRIEVTVTPVNGAPDNFRFQLYSEVARTNMVYELDTSEDGDYTPGDSVRDPNAGLSPFLYYIDLDKAVDAIEGDFWVRIHNDDASNSADFGFSIDYKAAV